MQDTTGGAVALTHSHMQKSTTPLPVDMFHPVLKITSGDEHLVMVTSVYEIYTMGE